MPTVEFANLDHENPSPKSGGSLRPTPIPSHLALVHRADLLPPIDAETTPSSFPPLRGEFPRSRYIYPQKSGRASTGASALLPFCSAAPSPRPRRGVTSPSVPATPPWPPGFTRASPLRARALLRSRHGQQRQRHFAPRLRQPGISLSACCRRSRSAQVFPGGPAP